MFLVKVMLIDPTAGAFAFKNEWDCMNMMLFNFEIMKILQELDESECQNNLPDPFLLFSNVNVIHDDYESNSSIDSSYSFDARTLSIEDLELAIDNRNPTGSKGGMIDDKNNSILDLIELNFEFEIKALDVQTRLTSLYDMPSVNSNSNSAPESEDDEADPNTVRRSRRLDRGLGQNDSGDLGDAELDLLNGNTEDSPDGLSGEKISNMISSAIKGTNSTSQETYETGDNGKITVDVLKKDQIDIDQGAYDPAELAGDLDEMSKGDFQFIRNDSPAQLIVK